MGTSTIVRRYWCAEASPPSTTRLLGVSHRRGDRIRTCGLLYLLQLGGAGAFLSRCSTKLSYTSVARFTPGQAFVDSALASTVALAARIGASEEAAHTVGASAVACAAHLAGSSCVFLSSLLVWGFTHVKLLAESVEVVRIWPTYSTPLLRGNMHYSK